MKRIALLLAAAGFAATASLPATASEALAKKHNCSMKKKSEIKHLKRSCRT